MRKNERIRLWLRKACYSLTVLASGEKRPHKGHAEMFPSAALANKKFSVGRKVLYREGTSSICPNPFLGLPFGCSDWCAIINSWRPNMLLSPSSSGLISLLFMTVSSIADSTLGLQADDPTSSLSSESYGPLNFPLINIEDGADLEIPISNTEFQQSELPKNSNGCSSYSNMGTNRSNRRLRLRRDDSCGWSDESRSHTIPSSSSSVVPLAVGTYIAGGTLSDKWGVCGNGLSMSANSIPVCTPVSLASLNGEAMTSLREGPYTDLLMARLCTVTFRLSQSETHSTKPFCQHVRRSWN